MTPKIIFEEYIKFTTKNISKNVSTSIVVFEMIRVQMIRAQYNLKLFSNKWLIVAILTSLLLQVIVIYVPYFNTLFKTTPLLLVDWISILIGGVILFVFGSLFNYLIRKTTKQID